MPLESALILEHVSTGDLNQPAQASWLTLRDTFTSLDLREAALAILSGCESGRLMPDAVDDYVNLPTGFLYAGARCVISTLRAINDLSGSLVMAKFHELWDAERGLAPALALRNAACWLRDEIRSKRQLERDILRPCLATSKTPSRSALATQHGASIPSICLRNILSRRPFIGRLSLRRACRFRYHSRQLKKSVATPYSLRHELWVRATITDDSKGERRFSSFASTRVNY